jgi:hypothetical protein
VYLDQLTLIEQTVGYGNLGMHGVLGYDGRMVSVQRHQYAHAFSAHAPSRLVFECGGRFQEFHCKVALNDDVALKGSAADFVVYADEHVVAAAPFVRAGDPPRELTANIGGAQQLTLITQTTEWASCHSLWLDPEVTTCPPDCSSVRWSDALARIQTQAPLVQTRAEHCIATVVSAGYAHLLDGLLESLRAQKLLSDTLIVVFNLGNDAKCGRVIAKHGAYGIPCQINARCNAAIKSVLYSVASLIDARDYICLDADMLVLDDLCGVFDAIEAHAPDSILIVRDAFLTNGNLLRQLCEHYRGQVSDLTLLLGRVNDEANYGLIVNDGFFAGSRRALLGVDNLIRNMPHAAAWVDHYSDHGWRNQFVFNLALARLRCAVELDTRYNLQLHMHDARPVTNGTRLQALWRGREAHVLHFCGWGRDKYGEWRGHFAQGELQ